MKLVFLDRAVLFTWILGEVGQRTNRPVVPTHLAQIETVRSACASCLEAGAKPAATLNSACDVVTEFYKSRTLPYVGELAGFPVRKSLAREAARLLRRRACLLSPTVEHFEHAERLWLRWCNAEAKESYAQFADYLDAALILSPPDVHTVPSVLLAHSHVHYILRKERATAMSYVVI